MFCTVCHVDFHYVTGKVSKVPHHNPHGNAWRASAAGKQEMRRREQGVAACTDDFRLSSSDLAAMHRLLCQGTLTSMRFLNIALHVHDENAAVFGIPEGSQMKRLHQRAHRTHAGEMYTDLVENASRNWGTVIDERVHRVLGNMSDAEFEKSVRQKVLVAEYVYMCAGVFAGVVSATREILRDSAAQYMEFPVALRCGSLLESIIEPRMRQMIVFFGDVLEQGSRVFGDDCVYRFVLRDLARIEVEKVLVV